VAKARAIATFTQLRFDVAIPLTESASYDLVVDDGDDLHGVRCKLCGNERGRPAPDSLELGGLS